MDPQENAIEYSQESQDLINQNDTLFEELQQQQRDAAEAQAQVAAEEAPVIPEEESLGITRDRTEAEDAQRVAGQGGQVRDIAGAVQSLTEGVDLEDRNFLQQASDAAAEFLGLRSEEESNEQRNEGIQQRQEDAETARQNNIVGSEAIRTVTGSVAGAAESTLEAAEIIGDFTKTLASKANIVGYDPKDDPFSDQYNWVSWNLGKDQLGAQTAAGKIAQGFGEFGVTFLALGGGSAVAGIGKGATGAKAVVSAMGREALEGVAADMVLAASGEGNLSNLIKENAPDWYPTWLTALSVDEDDNPFEAAFKTALEGGMLGAPIGAVGAYLKGARAGRKAIEEGATQAEAGEAALKASQEALAEPVKTTRAGQVKDYEKFAGESAQLATLRNMEEKGISATWDDVANVRPDLFIPGTRQIEAPAFSDEAMRIINDLDPTDPDAGATVNPFTGEVPTSGTMVAVDGASLDNLDDPDAVAGFIAKHYDVLTRDDVYLGSWVSQETGKPVVEISRLVQNHDEAVALGKLFDQEGVFRLDDFEYVGTGGLDQLKTTKGAHLKSISSRKVASTPVDAQKAAVQQVKSDQAISPNTGAQNVLTDAQVRRLGSAGPTRTTELLSEINAGSKIDVSELAAEANMSELEVVQEAAAKLGDDFGFLPADVSKLDLNPEGYLSRTGIVQSRMVMQEMSSRLSRAVFKANDATAKGMNNLEHVQEMVDTLKAFMKTYKVSANLNSKRLSAGGIELPKEFGVKGDALKNLYSGPDADGIAKAFDASEKMIDKMVEGLKGNNPKARKQALQIGAQLELLGDQPFKLAQGISTLQEVGTKLALKIMYNSMLSSPATHIVNTTSNAVAVVMRPLAAAAGGDIRSRKAAAASFYSLGETLSDAMEMASRKWMSQTENVKGTDVSTGEASMALDELELRAAESGDASFQTGVSVLRMIQGIADFPLFDWPSKALTTADEFFKTAVQRMEYKRMIMEEAIDLHGNDAEGAFKHIYEKEKALNFTKSGESLNKELNRIAKEVTFQQDLEGPAKKFGEWVESFPALRVFFPFVRTGHNVANYTASYVPVLAQAMERLGDTKFSELPPYEQAIIRGRQRIGAGFIAATGLMAANGMITGNGPMDPDARKRWLEQNQPRSLKIGDTFISLDRVEPFGPILSAVADIHYAVSNGEMKPDRAEWMVGYLTQAIAVNITDRTFFQGFQDMAKFISPRGGGTGERMAAFFADTANNLIPAAGMRRTLTNMLNPYMQEFNNQWDRTLYSATGGLLGDTATRYDFITGEPVGSMSGGINSLLPIKVNYKKQDPVKQALFDIEYNSDQIIEELGRTGLKLTPEQTSRLQQHMGSGQLHKELEEIVTSPDWQQAVKTYKERVSKGHRVSKTSQAFYREIHDTISIYADEAMSALKQDFPELDEALTDYQMDAATDRYGGLTEFYQQ